MASPREIRRRIRTVKNIEQITAAMKMVASVKLRKAQQRVEAARPYATQMQTMMTRLTANLQEEIEHPLLERREGPRLCLILVTADRGLSGSYNVNLIRAAHETLRGRNPQDVHLVLVGRKAAQHFRRHPYPVDLAVNFPSDSLTLSDIRPITNIATQLFTSNQVDEVQLLFAKFISPIVQRPTVLPLLPIQTVQEEAQGPQAGYIFEPEPAEILANLLPRYVQTQIYQALAEAAASQYGAQMTAMSNATTNAGDMVQGLTLALNRARQAAITKELAEIIGGVEALKG